MKHTGREMTPVLSLQGITKAFEPGAPVLRQVDLQVESGAVVCLLGASGCGKTTLLRLIAGFEEPTEGELYMIKRLVSRRGMVVPPEQRHIGMVFQDYALFPHLTIAQNIQFGLFRWPADWRRTRLAEMLALVGLQGMEKRYPHELSGGQQQRVALARALAPKPQLLLLDEPFSNLDVNLRQQLRDEMRAILSQAEITTVLVTHDQEEALSLADRLAVIDRGRIAQYATPDEVIRQPQTPFVAKFLGLGHFLSGEVRPHCIATELGNIPHGDDLHLAEGEHRVDILVRPESVRLCGHQDGTAAQVARVSFRGVRKLYTLRLPSGAQFCGLFASDAILRPGDQVYVAWTPEQIVAFANDHAHETQASGQVPV